MITVHQFQTSSKSTLEATIKKFLDKFETGKLIEGNKELAKLMNVPTSRIKDNVPSMKLDDYRVKSGGKNYYCNPKTKKML